MVLAKNDTAFQVDEIAWNLSGGIQAANLLIDDIVRYNGHGSKIQV
ncbi:hypothetical protein H0178_38985 [Cytobacillus firmus]|jgi:iron complex transport system substrate-binding protein|nr:hypothetical protein [Cytobacillus firmus]